ncbi:hypothetical protein ACM614_28965 [Streptomyces sp. 12297]
MCRTTPAPAVPGPIRDRRRHEGLDAVDAVLLSDRYPGVDETWHLMAVLIEHGDRARAAAAAHSAAADTTAAWDTLRTDGPGAGVSSLWMYVRTLALTLRTLYTVPGTLHEPELSPVSVGREALPPISPGGPEAGRRLNR